MSVIAIISYLILCVTLGAVADGFNERGWKAVGHPVEALEKVALLLVMYFTQTWVVVIAYALFRMALFDIIKNIAKGDPILYIGDSCAWDRFLSKFPAHGVTFARVVFFLGGIFVTYNRL